MTAATASHAVWGPSRTSIRAHARLVHPAPSRMELGCANHVAWAKHQMRISNSVLAAPPTRPGLVDSARNVVPDNNQILNRVRALHALSVELESGAPVAHALPVSSRTPLSLHVKHVLAVRRDRVVHVRPARRGRSLSPIAPDARRALLSAMRTCLRQVMCACSVVRAVSRMPI